MKCKDFTAGDLINSQLVDLHFRIVRIYVSVDMLTPLLTQLRSLPVVNHVRRVCVSVSDRCLTQSLNHGYLIVAPFLGEVDNGDKEEGQRRHEGDDRVGEERK